MATWIDLIHVRQAILPLFERNEQRFFGTDVMFSKEAQDVSYAGVVDASIEDVRQQLLSHDRVYPVNTACLKYVELSDGERVYEHGSYALRRNGFFSQYQTHVRFWPHLLGTAVWAHHELNPWVRPKSHYEGVDWDPAKGISITKDELLDIDESIPKNGVYKPKHDET